MSTYRQCHVGNGMKLLVIMNNIKQTSFPNYIDCNHTFKLYHIIIIIIEVFWYSTIPFAPYSLASVALLMGTYSCELQSLPLRITKDASVGIDVNNSLIQCKCGIQEGTMKPGQNLFALERAYRPISRYFGGTF